MEEMRLSVPPVTPRLTVCAAPFKNGTMRSPSIKRQLILLVVLVLIIPSIAINVLYYIREVDRIEKNRRILAENMVSRIAMGYSSMMDGFQLGRNAVIGVTLDWLRQPAPHSSSRSLRTVELGRLLTTVETSLPFVSGISVYDYTNGIVAASRKGYQKQELWNNLEEVLPQLGKSGTELFIGPRQAYYVRGAMGSSPYLYSYYLRLNTIANISEIVILQIDISLESLQTLLQFYDGNLFQKISLSSPEGVIIEQKSEKVGPSVRVRAPVEGTDWFVEASLDTPSISETGSNLRMVALLLAVLVAAYAATVAHIFSRSIAGPVQLMAKELFTIRSGTGEERVTIPKSRELLQIASGINDMLDGITLLHAKVIAHERSQHHAEIAALQSMIQPHFLFNTLETIRGLSISGESKAAADAAKNLAKMLRYTIGGGDYHSTVKEELAIATDYLTLQSLRFESRIHVTFDVSDSINTVGAPRWILQPILENAFKHAITPSKECVNVGIAVGIIGNEIVISVRDDGPGLEKEEVDRINRELELPIDRPNKPVLSGAHGLANVHHRLQLVYGDEAGLSLTSQKGIGTEITIRYPIRGETEG
jgi:sensor histidine kinase YesM